MSTPNKPEWKSTMTQDEAKAWFEAHPEPAIQSYPPLQEWLNKLDAVCDWQDKHGKGQHTTMIEQWRTRGSMPFILLIHSNGGGWDVFTCLHDIAVEATQRDAEYRIYPSRVKPTEHLVEAKLAINKACLKICDVKDSRVAAIWRELGKLADTIGKVASELNTIEPVEAKS